MRGEIKEFFIIKQRSLDCALFCCKALRKRLEHSRSREKHSTSSRVSPYTSLCSSRFLRALQQNRAQSRLLYLLSKINPPVFVTPLPDIFLALVMLLQMQNLQAPVVVVFLLLWDRTFFPVLKLFIVVIRQFVSEYLSLLLLYPYPFSIDGSFPIFLQYSLGRTKCPFRIKSLMTVSKQWFPFYEKHYSDSFSGYLKVLP